MSIDVGLKAWGGIFDRKSSISQQRKQNSLKQFAELFKTTKCIISCVTVPLDRWWFMLEQATEKKSNIISRLTIDGHRNSPLLYLDSIFRQKLWHKPYYIYPDSQVLFPYRLHELTLQLGWKRSISQNPSKFRWIPRWPFPLINSKVAWNILHDSNFWLHYRDRRMILSFRIFVQLNSSIGGTLERRFFSARIVEKNFDFEIRFKNAHFEDSLYEKNCRAPPILYLMI